MGVVIGLGIEMGLGWMWLTGGRSAGGDTGVLAAMAANDGRRVDTPVPPEPSDDAEEE